MQPIVNEIWRLQTSAIEGDATNHCRIQLNIIIWVIRLRASPGGIGRDGLGTFGVDGVTGNTSIGCLLFSFPLLAPLRISPRRPIGIELHVQLSFPPRQLVILGLLLASERMPLLVSTPSYGNKREMHNRRLIRLAVGGRRRPRHRC